MKTELTIQTVAPTDRHLWDAHTTHPLQSWAWGEFRKKIGTDTLRVGVYKNNALTQGLQITFHTIPYTPYTIGYVPKTSMFNSDTIRALTLYAKKKNAVFIQIEPNIQQSKTNHLPNHMYKKTIIPSHRPLFTKHNFIIDLSKSKENLLTEFHKKTRYNIRLAKRKGVTISHDNSKKSFDAYIRLTKETTKRQAFYAHDETYQKAMWSVMRKENIAHLFTASYKNTIITAWIIFVWKNTIYYPYGASSRLYKNVMAPNLMMWETILWAKKRGLTFYDLWGALGPEADPNDPFYGFHRFKQGYTPKSVELIGSFSYISRPLLYQVYKIADNCRWSILHAKGSVYKKFFNT